MYQRLGDLISGKPLEIKGAGLKVAETDILTQELLNEQEGLVKDENEVRGLKVSIQGIVTKLKNFGYTLSMVISLLIASGEVNQAQAEELLEGDNIETTSSNDSEQAPILEEEDINIQIDSLLNDCNDYFRKHENLLKNQSQILGFMASIEKPTDYQLKQIIALIDNITTETKKQNFSDLQQKITFINNQLDSNFTDKNPSAMVKDIFPEAEGKKPIGGLDCDARSVLIVSILNKLGHNVEDVNLATFYGHMALINKKDKLIYETTVNSFKPLKDLDTNSISQIDILKDLKQFLAYNIGKICAGQDNDNVGLLPMFRSSDNTKLYKLARRLDNKCVTTAHNYLQKISRGGLENAPEVINTYSQLIKAAIDNIDNINNILNDSQANEESQEQIILKVKPKKEVNLTNSEEIENEDNGNIQVGSENELLPNNQILKKAIAESPYIKYLVTGLADYSADLAKKTMDKSAAERAINLYENLLSVKPAIKDIVEMDPKSFFNQKRLLNCYFISGDYEKYFQATENLIPDKYNSLPFVDLDGHDLEWQLQRKKYNLEAEIPELNRIYIENKDLPLTKEDSIFVKENPHNNLLNYFNPKTVRYLSEVTSLQNQSAFCESKIDFLKDYKIKYQLAKIINGEIKITKDNYRNEFINLYMSDLLNTYYYENNKDKDPLIVAFEKSAAYDDFLKIARTITLNNIEDLINNFPANEVFVVDKLRSKIEEFETMIDFLQKNNLLEGNDLLENEIKTLKSIYQVFLYNGFSNKYFFDNFSKNYYDFEENISKWRQKDGNRNAIADKVLNLAWYKAYLEYKKNQ